MTSGRSIWRTASTRRHEETSEPIPCPSLRPRARVAGSNPGAAIRPSGLLAPRMLWPLDCFVARAPRNDGWVAADPIDSVVIGRRQAGLREYGTLRRLPAGLARQSSLGVSQRARQRRRAELSTPGRALGALALRSVRGSMGSAPIYFNRAGTHLSAVSRSVAEKGKRIPDDGNCRRRPAFSLFFSIAFTPAGEVK